MNQDSDSDTTPSSFERFEDLAKRLLAVPKSEVDAKAAERPRKHPKKHKPRHKQPISATKAD